MFRRFVLANLVFSLVASLIHAETFLATITKVDGNKVTYLKTVHHRGKSRPADKYTYEKPVTVVAAKEIVVTRGHFVPADEPMTSKGRITGKTTPLAGGLSDVLKKGNVKEGAKLPRPSLITIADDGADKGKIAAINLWSSDFPK